MLLLLACAPDVSNAEIAVDPASIDLGPLEMSTVPESTDLTVTNTGAGDLLEVQASTGLAGLSVEPATLSLEAGVAGTVTVTWLGAASGAFGDLDGTVYLVSNAATSGYLEVPFSATIESGDVSAVPTSVDLGTVTDTATGTLEIVPDSGGASVTALSFDDPRFSATATLPSTVWASLPLTVEVAFSAKGVAPGRYTSALTVTTSSDSAEVATVVATVE